MNLRKLLFTVLVLSLFCTTFIYAQFGGFDIGDAVKGVSGASKVAKGAAGIGLKEELDIGGSLAVEIAAKKGGVLKDTALTKRVATIGKALALYSTRPEIPYTFAVLDNASINAFSAPGGYVFVTKGLVDSCSSDKQLAGILAHEIAHITRRHALKLVARNEGLKGMTELASVAGGGDISGYDDLISKGIQSILNKGFDPATEFDADKHGTQLIYDTGFPPKTLRDYLTALKDDDEKIFSTHPPTKHRVERLDEFINEVGLSPKD
jgi:beta-barrel assembly-enhancing protease